VAGIKNGRVVAILVTVVAIIIPVFTYAPKLHVWFLQSHLKNLYRRLRVIETEMEVELTPSRTKRCKRIWRALIAPLAFFRFGTQTCFFP
jgi:hypothetical protein